LTLNISADSIYTGALGAALFARREWLRSGGGSPPAAGRASAGNAAETREGGGA
jgi:hypothetical protein